MWIGVCSNNLLKILPCISLPTRWYPTLLVAEITPYSSHVPYHFWLLCLCRSCSFSLQSPLLPALDFQTFLSLKITTAKILIPQQQMGYLAIDPSVAFLSLPLLWLRTCEPILGPWLGTSGRGRPPSDSTLNPCAAGPSMSGVGRSLPITERVTPCTHEQPSPSDLSWGPWQMPNKKTTWILPSRSL